MSSAAPNGKPLYQIIDIGANLTSGKFGRELDQVVDRAAQAGVFKIMVTGSSIESSKDGKTPPLFLIHVGYASPIFYNQCSLALRLSRLYPNHLFSTAGVHPHEAKDWDDSCADNIAALAKNLECVAIGKHEHLTSTPLVKFA